MCNEHRGWGAKVIQICLLFTISRVLGFLASHPLGARYGRDRAYGRILRVRHALSMPLLQSGPEGYSVEDVERSKLGCDEKTAGSLTYPCSCGEAALLAGLHQFSRTIRIPSKMPCVGQRSVQSKGIGIAETAT